MLVHVKCLIAVMPEFCFNVSPFYPDEMLRLGTRSIEMVRDVCGDIASRACEYLTNVYGYQVQFGNQLLDECGA